MSQSALAKKLGVTQQCVSEWELGRTEPTMSYLWRIADISDASMDEVCGRKEWGC